MTIRAPAANRKLAPVSMVANDSPRLRPTPRAPFVVATYAPVEQTCPDTCGFKHDGCMAESGFTGGGVRKLNERAKGMTPRDLAKYEAAQIDLTWKRGVPQLGGRDGTRGIDMRLHVSGDCTTSVGAYWLAGAAWRWMQRGGGIVWTFTHAWRLVKRSAWGSVSVLASIERAVDAARARAQGYAPALVVDEFPDGAKTFERGDTKWIPCPAESRGTTCVQCRLCLERTDWMRETNHGIAFAVHGPQQARARRHLEVIS